MKPTKILTILGLSATLLILPVTTKADIFDDILNDIEEFVGDIGELLNIDFGDIFDVTEEVRKYTLEKTGGSDMLDMCYVYSPPRLKPINVSINACNLLPKLDFDLPDPCSVMPDLSIAGYTKKKFNYDINITNYCDLAFGKQKEWDLEDITKNVNLNKNLFAIGKEDEEAKESPFTLEEANKNPEVIKAMMSNDYEAVTVYRSLLNASSKEGDIKKPEDIDVSNINVSYETNEDYEKSVEEQVEAFAKLKEELNLNKFKANALSQYLKVNSETENNEERYNQKLAVKDKLLDEYEEILKKFRTYRKRQRLLLEHKDAVVQPTKSFVGGYETKDRASVIYAIEKQKAHKAKIITEVNQEVDAYRHKAKLIVDKTLYATHEFDRTKAFEAIKKLIGADGGEEGSETSSKTTKGN